MIVERMRERKTDSRGEFTWPTTFSIASPAAACPASAARRSPTPASPTRSACNASSACRSRSMRIEVTKALRDYHADMADATAELHAVTPQTADEPTLLGLIGWGRHVVKVVGFDMPMPADAVAACVRPAHFDPAYKARAYEHVAHVMLYYAGYERDPLEQYVALAAISGGAGVFRRGLRAERNRPHGDSRRSAAPARGRRRRHARRPPPPAAAVPLLRLREARSGRRSGRVDADVRLSPLRPAGPRHVRRQPQSRRGHIRVIRQPARVLANRQTSGSRRATRSASMTTRSSECAPARRPNGISKATARCLSLRRSVRTR